VKIVDVEAVLDRAEADLIRRADGLPALHASAGHPHGEAGRIVIAPVAFLALRRAAKLAAPDDECAVEAGRALSDLSANPATGLSIERQSFEWFSSIFACESHLLPAPL